MTNSRIGEFWRYIAAIDESFDESTDGREPLSQLFVDTVEILTVTLGPDVEKGDPVASLLYRHASSLLLGAGKLALSGHSSAVYPVARTSLEAGCYAYLIQKVDPSAGPTWLSRHKDEAHRAACKKKFSAAVRLTADALRADGETNLSALVSEAYEGTIDFGAHPNARGLLTRTRITEENGFANMDIGVVLEPATIEFRRALLACVEIAFCIGALECLGCGREDDLATFNSLVERKQEIVAQFATSESAQDQ